MRKKIQLLMLLCPLFAFSQWTQIGLDIDGEDAGDESGYGVSLSSDGTTVAIGAPYNNDFGFNTGHVRIFKNISGVWTQIGADIDGEAASDFFGESVSLSSDGSIVAIGARYNNGNGSLSGHVRIYEYSGGTWTQIGTDIDGEATGDSSGFSVSLSSDGATVAIGAYLNNGNVIDSGHVRIFENISGTWIQIGADIDGEAPNDISGFSVSLSSNGAIVAIGAPNNDGNGSNSGHVRIFENISGTWTQVGVDIDGEAVDDSSGAVVSLSSDGTIVAIGAPFNDDNGNYSGHVRVFENVSGIWTQIGNDIDGLGANEFSGRSVSISSDGTIVAIGAPLNDGVNGVGSGHVRIFQNVSGVWTQVGPDIDGEADGDQSGSTGSVSLSFDGTIIAIGGHFNDGNGSNSGHVRIFTNPVLSIQKNTFGSLFNVFPNPSNGVSKINLGENYNEVNLQVLDILGKVVATEKHTNTNEVILNTESYTTGIYFIKVQSGAKGATIKLVVE